MLAAAIDAGRGEQVELLGHLPGSSRSVGGRGVDRAVQLPVHGPALDAAHRFGHGEYDNL